MRWVAACAAPLCSPCFPCCHERQRQQRCHSIGAGTIGSLGHSAEQGPCAARSLTESRFRCPRPTRTPLPLGAPLRTCALFARCHATLYCGRTRPRRRTALALTVAAALESARMARGCGPAALGVCLLYPDRTHAFSNTAREARLRRVAAASPQALRFRVIGSQRLALSTPQCTGCGCGLHGGRLLLR